MDKNKNILFILSRADTIKKLLSSMPLSNLEERHRLTTELFSLDFTIKKYSKKEIDVALEIDEYKKADIKKKVIIEDDPELEQEDDFFYWLAVTCSPRLVR